MDWDRPLGGSLQKMNSPPSQPGGSLAALASNLVVVVEPPPLVVVAYAGHEVEVSGMCADPILQRFMNVEMPKLLQRNAGVQVGLLWSWED